MSTSRGTDPLRVRQLTPADDRSRFTSGDEALDRYFRLYAGQNQFRHHLGLTYVAIEAEQIVGFMTVSAGELSEESMPNRRAHALPILRLARLAIDQTVQGRGIGERLLFECLRLATEMKNSVGCGGVVVDAKYGATGFYERYGFAGFKALEGGAHGRPATTPMILPVRLIEAAVGPMVTRPRR